VIEGTSPAQLAAQLGLDSSRFGGGRAGGVAWEREADAGLVPRALLPPDERFKGADPLLVRCLRCGTEGAFGGALVAVPGTMPGAPPVLRSGLFCSRAGCPGVWGSREAPQPAKALGAAAEVAAAEARLSNALALATRRAAAAYQAGWMVCEDPLCGTRTRAQGGAKHGYACPRAGCKNILRLERESAQVHVQLEYFAHLFNLPLALHRAEEAYGKDKEAAPKPPAMPKTADEGGILRVLSESRELPYGHTLVLDALLADARRALAASAYHYVATTPLFAYVGRMNDRHAIAVAPVRLRKDKEPKGGAAAAAAAPPPPPAFATPTPKRRGGSSLLALGATYSVDAAAAAAAAAGAGAKMRRLDSGLAALGRGGGFMALSDE